MQSHIAINTTRHSALLEPSPTGGPPTLSRVTLIDSQTAGIAGDMLLGGLIDAGADVKLVQSIIGEIPQHYSKCKSIQLETRNVSTHGFRACGIDFHISEDRDEVRVPDFLDASKKIAESSRLGANAQAFALHSVRSLVESEAKLHGLRLEDTHLHEAGSADTLGDIFGVAAACDSLGVFESETYSTPVAVGGGLIKFSHGRVSGPAPAALEMLRAKGFPLVGGPAPVELATPTGVSMLVNLTHNFAFTYPPMVPEKVGYGAGKMELPNAPNLLRVVIGRKPASPDDLESVYVLETNLDDVPGEILGHALQRVFDSGGKDAWLTPAYFKKQRPGYVLHALCDREDLEKVALVIIEETGTLGVRYQEWHRFILERETKKLKVTIGARPFEVRVKIARDDSGRIVRIKPEFEDARAIAESLSLPFREVSEILASEARKQLKENGKNA